MSDVREKFRLLKKILKTSKISPPDLLWNKEMTVATSNDNFRLSVGSRVECEGYNATVMYIGEVPPTKGLWLGVEWDDSSRGKHDGSKDNKRYFSTHHPTSGSFLRPKKVNAGSTFMDEVRDRYGRVDDEAAGIVEEDMFVVGHGGKQTAVEVVGAKKVNLKQSEFSKLKEVSVRGTCIRGAGESGDIAASLPSVEELDISLNLINSWQEVARITEQLPHLVQLNISDNVLSFVDSPEKLKVSFQKCRTVFLNRMKYSWEQVALCCEMFPCLRQLHICFNNINQIDHLPSSMHNLTLLNLESNPIKDWHYILQIGSLIRLETLILNDCSLEKVVFPDTSMNSCSPLFPVLKSISLSQNNISEWTSIDELHKLVSLTEFTFRKNPVLSPKNTMTDSYIIIAKLSRLKLLNRSQVTGDDRKGAEVDYLKMYGKEWRSCGGHQDPQQNKPSQAFINQHPRFQALIEKYGPPEDSELKAHSSALKNSLISIMIDSPLEPSKAPIKKKLPDSMTVQKLKAILQRLYKVDPISMKLTYTSEKMSDQEIELDVDGRELSFYSVEDGDTIHVKW